MLIKKISTNKMENQNQNQGSWIPAAAGTAAGLLGMIGQKRREKRALKNQIKLMGIQQQNQMELNKQGSELQYEMWEKTNYPAQIKMLEAAGLNPGLIYGSAGAGGVTGSQGGGSAAGGNAPAIQPMGIETWMQAAMLKSQKELQDSQAEKNRAEAEKIRGIDTKEGETRVESLTQGIENQKANEILTRIQGELTAVQKEIAETSKEGAINEIMYRSKKIMREGELLDYETDVAKDTIEEKKSIIRQALANAVVEGSLKKAGVEKTEEEIRSIKQGVQQKWEQIRQEWNSVAQGWNKSEREWRQLVLSKRETVVKEYESLIKADYPNIQQVIGGGLEDFVRNLSELTIEDLLYGDVFQKGSKSQEERKDKRPK